MGESNLVRGYISSAFACLNRKKGRKTGRGGRGEVGKKGWRERKS